MSHSATVRVAFETEDEARQLLGALAPDDDGHADLRIEDAQLIIEARSSSALGLLRTLDELVAALAAAEKARRIASA